VLPAERAGDDILVAYLPDNRIVGDVLGATAISAEAGSLRATVEIADAATARRLAAGCEADRLQRLVPETVPAPYLATRELEALVGPAPPHADASRPETTPALTWTDTEGLEWSVAVARPSSGLTAEAIANHFVSEEAARCRGAFQTAREPGTAGDGALVRARTVCTTDVSVVATQIAVQPSAAGLQRLTRRNGVTLSGQEAAGTRRAAHPGTTLLVLH
jgi:hypothetical protein